MVAIAEQLRQSPSPAVQKESELPSEDDDEKMYSLEVLTLAAEQMEFSPEQKEVLLIMASWMIKPNIHDLAKRFNINPIEAERIVNDGIDRWDEELGPAWDLLQVKAEKVDAEIKKNKPAPRPKISLQDQNVREEKFNEVCDLRKTGLPNSQIAKETGLTLKQVKDFVAKLIKSGQTSQRPKGRKLQTC